MRSAPPEPPDVGQRLTQLAQENVELRREIQRLRERPPQVSPADRAASSAERARQFSAAVERAAPLFAASAELKPAGSQRSVSFPSNPSTEALPVGRQYSPIPQHTPRPRVGTDPEPYASTPSPQQLFTPPARKAQEAVSSARSLSSEETAPYNPVVAVKDRLLQGQLRAQAALAALEAVPRERTPSSEPVHTPRTPELKDRQTPTPERERTPPPAWHERGTGAWPTPLPVQRAATPSRGAFSTAWRRAFREVPAARGVVKVQPLGRGVFRIAGQRYQCCVNSAGDLLGRPVGSDTFLGGASSKRRITGRGGLDLPAPVLLRKALGATAAGSVEERRSRTPSPRCKRAPVETGGEVLLRLHMGGHLREGLTRAASLPAAPSRPWSKATLRDHDGTRLKPFLQRKLPPPLLASRRERPDVPRRDRGMSRDFFGTYGDLSPTRSRCGGSESLSSPRRSPSFHPSMDRFEEP